MSQLNHITQHDLSLIVILGFEKMPLDEIAFKFEAPRADLALMAWPVNDFNLKPSLLEKRLVTGRMRLGEDSLERRCGRCGEYYPFTREFWHKYKLSVDGAWNLCIGCELTRRQGKGRKK